MMRRKIMVAMSGGVDSSVAALLLKERGGYIVGVTMCLGLGDGVGGKKPSCCDASGIEDSRRVCRDLGIPHYVIDLSREFEDRVINPFVDEYAKGRTPNPCVACNRRLKFGALLEKARALGFHALATGHYARLHHERGGYFIARAHDIHKDQSYFLSTIPREALFRIRFPLADLTKSDVRSLAWEKGLPVADKPESQDICFIPGGDIPGFIEKRLGNAGSTWHGLIRNTDGDIVGRHRGVFRYTIGQRRGLGVQSVKPLYVIAIDSSRNLLIVGGREKTYAHALYATDVMGYQPAFSHSLEAKIRSTHKPAVCAAVIDNGGLYITFDEPQAAVTPGQIVALYRHGIVVGSGVIESAARYDSSETTGPA